MKQFTRIFITACLAVFVISCAGTTNTERKTKEGTLVGAGLGAVLGQVIGKDSESTAIGAGIGAALGGITGNRIGAYMDKQEADLRNAVASSQSTSVMRSQNVLRATFQSKMLFDINSAVLKPGAYSEIGRVSRVLNDYPGTRITVEGHTDASGSEQYNLELSQKRAGAVKNALVQRGVDPVRIQTMGFGESQPISSNAAENRRVTIVITPVER
ncbi:MAG: OmpA family protein [Desulfobacteraceae bacterium]